MTNLPLVDLAAPPFRGHLHPILGIARALEAAGFATRLLSTGRGLARAAAAGLAGEGVAFLRGCDDDADRIIGGNRATGSNPLALHAQLRANLRLMRQFHAETAALYRQRRPDLLIADFTLPVAGAVATAHGVPWWTSHPSPCVAEAVNGEGVPAYLGGWSPRGGWTGRWRDRLGHAAVRGFKRAVGAWHRRELAALGLPGVYRGDGTEAVYSPECVLGLSWPELEFPRRWPSAFRLVGPVLYTPPAAAGEIPRFEPGRRHVLVTLGTHLTWLKDRAAAATALAAAALPEVVFHFSDGQPDVGGGGEAVGVGPANFRRFAYVPYGPCLPRYDLVVHHGGAGIMHSCLRLGRPAVVFPVDFDQFDHAARLVRAGVARRLGRLTDLTRVVSAALADEGLANRCRSFQTMVAAAPTAEDTIAGLVRARLTGDICNRPPTHPSPDLGA